MTIFESILGFTESPLSTKYPIAEQLIPIDSSTQKELERNGIIDLTAELWEKHRKGEIDLDAPFCFGRDREILQISVLLSTIESPGNILITGATGCGKTILIYELARQILMRPNDQVLTGQHVFLMMGRDAPKDGKRGVHKPMDGEFMRFLAEKVGKKAILVFDECHNNLTSARPNITSLKELFTFDFSGFADKNKPLLSENTLSIIGLTDRLGNFLTHDPARERRFTVIELEELSIEGTIDVIRKKNFQKKKGRQLNRPISIGDETLRMAVYLSMAYHKKICLPSKAYLILDPAVSWYLKMHPKVDSVPPEAIVDYMVTVLACKREEVVEKFEQMDDLAHSPIPPHEPLAKYTINMSSMARRGKLAPAWGRAEIIGGLGLIFGQEEFNNALLTAPPGAGKTRIAEGLAFAIEQGELPELAGRQVLLINWDLAKKDLQAFLKSARKYQGKFILVIDEAHRLSGNRFSFAEGLPGTENMEELLANPLSAVSGALNRQGSEGGAHNELKEAMGRGELPSLLLTTNREADALLGDPAFMRRVEWKKLDCLSKEQIELVLQKEMPTLSKRYDIDNLTLMAEAGESVYYLSKLYYKEEFQPSASFKVLHTVCAHARRKGVSQITSDSVFNALASKEGVKASDVKNIYLREKDADHPSSRRIPDDEALKRFSDDWTKEARMHPPSGFVGHEKTFHAMQGVLARATCNNVLLIGRAGTGKTTLVRRLAEFMAFEDEQRIPQPLRNKPLLALRFSELREDRRAFAEFVASAKAYGGQYVLFIDEIHILFGSAGGFLLPNFSREIEELKPLLADGRITLIGATTEEDLHHVQLNHAVKRRFTALEVSPPTRQEAVRMLQAKQTEMEFQISERLGQHVQFTPNAFQHAVALADPEQLPASAISILEIGAVEAQRNAAPPSVILVTENALTGAEESYFERLEQPPNINMGDAFHAFNMARTMMGGSDRRGASSDGFWTSLGRNILAFITSSFQWLADFFT